MFCAKISCLACQMTQSYWRRQSACLFLNGTWRTCRLDLMISCFWLLKRPFFLQPIPLIYSRQCSRTRLNGWRLPAWHCYPGSGLALWRCLAQPVHSEWFCNFLGCRQGRIANSKTWRPKVFQVQPVEPAPYLHLASLAPVGEGQQRSANYGADGAIDRPFALP